MQPKEWFTRKFNHQHEPGIFPCIVERLKGTAVRLEAKIQDIASEKLIQKNKDKWSIQEHVGHLLDLEPLWYGRVKDIVAGEKVLREADLSNRKTFDAHHNDRSIAAILSEFRTERQKLTAALEQVPAKDFEKTALHPRLLVPMKMIDLAYFVAEHDDHHLAMINYLMNE